MVSKVKYREVVKEGQLIIEELHKIVVHSFRMGDAEDPDLYAAQPLYDWQHSDAGQFVMKNAAETPEWHRYLDHSTMGYVYSVTAILEKKKLSEYYLRFCKKPA